MVELAERQQENLAVARAAWDAYGAEDTDGVLAQADPEIEIYMPSDLPNSGIFRGHDGYLTWLGNWLEAWEDFTVDVQRMEPVGERHVVTSAHQSGVGKGSGVPVEMDVAYMVDIRGGKIAALHLYMTREEAIDVAERREREAPD
jgi:ketosteroid isomerase-like protein